MRSWRQVGKMLHRQTVTGIALLYRVHLRVKVRRERKSAGPGESVTEKKNESCPQKHRGGIVVVLSVYWKVVSSYLIPAASRVSEEMSVVNMDTLSQDDLKKRVMALVSIDDWSDACLQCSRPSLLHKGGPCTRSEKEPSEKILEIWEEFRKRTKAVVTIVKAESYR